MIIEIFLNSSILSRSYGTIASSNNSIFCCSLTSYTSMFNTKFFKNLMISFQLNNPNFYQITFNSFVDSNLACSYCINKDIMQKKSCAPTILLVFIPSLKSLNSSILFAQTNLSGSTKCCGKSVMFENCRDLGCNNMRQDTKIAKYTIISNCFSKTLLNPKPNFQLYFLNKRTFNTTLY